MRLTLRTLLAYRDGVLSESDYQDLHRRIQQSPDAGNLLRRINELVAQNDLPTPKLDATGLRGPNVVAEYLDDVLSTSRIAELERLCLEYSEHLCELAHCHHLLAGAINAHVVVPESLRTRAVQLVDASRREEIRAQLLTQSRKLAKRAMVAEVPTEAQPESPLPITQTVINAPQQAGLNLEAASLTHEVPEYLLGARKRRWQFPAAILALSALLCLLVWQSVGSWQDLKKLLLAQSPSLEPSERAADSTPAPTLPAKQPEHTTLPTTESRGEVSSRVSGKVTESTTTDPQSAPAESTDASDQEAADSETTSEGLAAVVPEPPRAAVGSEVKNVVDAAGPTSGSSQAAAQPGTQSGFVLAPREESERKNVVLQNTGDAWRLLRSGQDSEPNGARRASSIDRGRLILAPSVRTTIASSDWNCLLAGPASLEISHNAGKLEITSNLCRLMLSLQSASAQSESAQSASAQSESDQSASALQESSTTGLAAAPQTKATDALDTSASSLTKKPTAQPASFLLKSPCGEHLIEVLDPSVWLSVEVSYRRVDRGSLAEAGIYKPVLVVIAGTDSAVSRPQLVRVTSLGNGSIAVIESIGDGLAVIDRNDMEKFSLQSPPGWFRKRSIRPIDLMAQTDLFTALEASAEPIEQQLRVLARDRRPEVAAAAIQYAMLLDDWQPFASELLLSDRMRAHWRNTLDLARQLLAAKPGLAKSIESQFQLTLGADANRALELLIGLPASLQTNDSLLGLVKGMDNGSSLPIRVLSWYELSQQTGEPGGYQPHAPTRAALQQVRSSLNANRAPFLPVRDPITERTAPQ